MKKTKDKKKNWKNNTKSIARTNLRTTNVQTNDWKMTAQKSEWKSDKDLSI